MEPLQCRGDFRDAEHGVERQGHQHARRHETPTAETQCRSDQSAQCRRGYGCGDTLHAGLNQQHAGRAITCDQSCRELRREPDQRRSGGEADCAKRSDDEAVQRVSRGTGEPHHQHWHEHQDRSTDRNPDACEHRQPPGFPVCQGDVVEGGHQRAGRRRPADTEPDAKQCGRYQHTKRRNAVPVRLIQVEQEYKRQGKGADRDHRRLPPQQPENDQQQEDDGEAGPESRARALRKMREQGARHGQPHHRLVGRRHIRLHPEAGQRPFCHPGAACS